MVNFDLPWCLFIETWNTKANNGIAKFSSTSKTLTGYLSVQMTSYNLSSKYVIFLGEG